MLNEILKGLGRILGQVVLDEIATGGQVADPKTRKIRPRNPQKVRRRQSVRARPGRARAETEVVDVEAELVCPFCLVPMAEHRGTACPK